MTSRLVSRLGTLVAAQLLMAAGAFAQPVPTPAAPVAAPSAAAPNDYAKAENWLCLPGRTDACTGPDLSTTVVAPDGSTTIEAFTPSADPKFDCFYVYPTVSAEPTPNSDMTVTSAETNVALVQAARFTAECRVFAPMYRQVTLAALRAGMSGKPNPGSQELAAADVRDAWRYYLTHENKGRGVVLIGHSQGTRRLTQLIGEEIEGKPVQSQIISALLIGGHIEVEAGRDIGGDFKFMPMCHNAEQTGCVVAFNSFRAEIPPPANSYFARPTTPGREVPCTNPAALAGGEAPLHAYMLVHGNMGSSSPAPDWTGKGAPITTTFVSLPGLLVGRCVTENGATFLQISLASEPTAVRTRTYNGDIMIGPSVLKTWGLHLIDMNLTEGDLLSLVQIQSRNWLTHQRLDKGARR